MADTYILQDQYFGQYYIPALYFPFVYIFTTATPACRTYSVAFESRTLAVDTESRTFSIDAESRTYTVPQCIDGGA